MFSTILQLSQSYNTELTDFLALIFLQQRLWFRVSPAVLLSSPQNIIQEIFQEVVSFTWGMMTLQLIDYEDFDPDFKSYRFVIWDYSKYSPAVAKKGSAISPANDHWFPQEELMMQKSLSHNKCYKEDWCSHTWSSSRGTGNLLYYHSSSTEGYFLLVPNRNISSPARSPRKIESSAVFYRKE